MHPGPKTIEDGTKVQHASHDVKMGHGGNDTVIRGGPSFGTPIQHNTIVQEQPGNTVKIHTLTETTLTEENEEEEEMDKKEEMRKGDNEL